MKYAIFDMDGTLIDSMYYWRTVALEYLQEQGYNPDAALREQLYFTSVRKTPDVMRAHFDLAATDAELVDEFESRMTRHYERDVKLKPGAARYIAQLRAQGVACALATASFRAQAWPLMQRLGIADAFLDEQGQPRIVCADELGVTKASDEYYPRLCRLLGAEPGDCVLFEDALYSMRTAHRAGLHIWAIEDETARRHRDEIIALAERYFTCWDELIK